MKNLNDNKTYCIFFDTSIVGNPDNYDFQKSIFATFIKNISKGIDVDIVTSDLVLNEIKKNIEDRLENDKNIDGHSNYFKKIKNDIIEELKKKYNDDLNSLITENNIKMIKTSDYVNGGEIIESYMNLNYPFEKRKKYEFPDAFIINTILEFKKKNKYDEFIILTNDLGFKKCINEKDKDINVITDLNQIIRPFTGISYDVENNIKRYVNSQKILSKKDIYNIYSNYEIIENNITEVKNKFNSKKNNVWITFANKPKIIHDLDIKNTKDSKSYRYSTIFLNIEIKGLFTINNVSDNKTYTTETIKVEDIPLELYFEYDCNDKIIYHKILNSINICLEDYIEQMKII